MSLVGTSCSTGVVTTHDKRKDVQVKLILMVELLSPSKDATGGGTSTKTKAEKPPSGRSELLGSGHSPGFLHDMQNMSGLLYKVQRHIHVT